MANIDLKKITVYEDESIVVLNKPSGLLTVPGRNVEDNTNLYALLKEKYGNIFIVHRLDKETSGLIIFAKNADAHRNLSIQFERGKVTKKYFAIVHGKPPAEDSTIRYPLAPSKRRSMRGCMYVDPVKGKKAVTLYKLISTEGKFSKVEAEPKTGRTHQIRVHFAHLGCPVAGDKTYGDAEKPAAQRLLLHSAYVEFSHPVTGEKKTITSVVPDDFKISKPKKISLPRKGNWITLKKLKEIL